MNRRIKVLQTFTPPHQYITQLAKYAPGTGPVDGLFPVSSREGAVDVKADGEKLGRLMERTEQVQEGRKQ